MQRRIAGGRPGKTLTSSQWVHSEEHRAAQSIKNDSSTWELPSHLSFTKLGRYLLILHYVFLPIDKGTNLKLETDLEE